MLHYPSTITVTVQEKTISFHVSEICHNVFAIQERIHAMETMDGFTFGYVVYYEGYLHAYVISTEKTPRPQLIFVCYIGPEEEFSEETDTTINTVFQTVGLAVAEHSIHKNVHPADLDRETFQKIYADLQRVLDSGDINTLTPYVVPMRDMAVNLRDFYATMVTNLDALDQQFPNTEEND